MTEQQQMALAEAVQSTLKQRNLTVNAASIRLRIDRQALTRFANGIPMTLENVERFARGLRLDVNEWREKAGYQPIEPSPEDALRTLVEGEEIRVKSALGKVSPQDRQRIRELLESGEL